MRASQSAQRSAGRVESGCAAIDIPPIRRTSSTTSPTSPPSGNGVCGRPNATTCPPFVLISTASMHRTPLSIDRSIRTTRPIAMVGDDHELQPGPPRRRGDVFNRASAIRSTRVHVNRTANRTVRAIWRQRTARLVRRAAADTTSHRSATATATAEPSPPHARG